MRIKRARTIEELRRSAARLVLLSMVCGTCTALIAATGATPSWGATVRATASAGADVKLDETKTKAEAGEPTPSESPDQTPEPSEPAPEAPSGPTSIELLNPYTASPMLSIGDRFDGVDRTFQIVARVVSPPSDAVVEAYYQGSTGNEKTIGALEAKGSGIWELGWQISDPVPEGRATFRVRLFSPATSGNAVIDSDEVVADLKHIDNSTPTDTTDQSAVEATELLWAAQTGQLGFYKGAGGKWTTTVDGLASVDTTGVQILYSATPPGQDVAFTPCTSGSKLDRRSSDGIRTYQAGCTLTEGDVPSSVTAIAAIPSDGRDGAPDVHAVSTYIPDPHQMSVSLTPLMARALAGSKCFDLTATVVDELERPVRGVNLDLGVQGPDDTAAFGQPADSKVPDGAVQEEASNCLGGSQGAQGTTILPLEPDLKRVESIDGTDMFGEWRFKVFSPDPGLTEVSAWVDDGALPAETAARNPDDDVMGAEEPTALARRQWLDDALRLTFLDRFDSMPVGACNAYRMRVAAGDSILPGINVDVHARFPSDDMAFCDAGSDTPHRMPDDGDHPPGGVGDSHPSGSDQCAGSGPKCEHIEGETNANGVFTLGLTSAPQGASGRTAAGGAQLTAWIDGEPGEDNDVLDFGEATDLTTTNWVDSARDAEIRLINPSGFKGGNLISSSRKIVTMRVDAPYAVPGVELLLVSGSSSKKVGEAKRVGLTDTYEFDWDLREVPGAAPTPTASPSPSPSTKPRPSPTQTKSPSPSPSSVVTPPVSPSPPPSPPAPQPAPTAGAAPGVADGSYTLRARIIGTDQHDDVNIVINRGVSPATQDTQSNLPEEWIQIKSPKNASGASFANGAILIQGDASPGAEGIYLYYATGTSRQAPRWINEPCGYVDLLGTGTAVQSFAGECALQGNDAPAEITAVAAAPFDCSTQGCDANPHPAPVLQTSPAPEVAAPAPSGALESGDARRIVGCADSTCVVLATESFSRSGSCQKVVLRLTDEEGKPFGGSNVNIALEGPGDRTRFCNLPEGMALHAPGPAARAQKVQRDPLGPDTILAEGTADGDGLFVFGIASEDSSYGSIFSVIQRGGTKIRAWADRFDDNEWNSDEGGVVYEILWDLPGRCSIVGTNGDDLLAGEIEADKICALGGNDTIYAQEGKDVILGGAGDDDIYGDDGIDLILAMEGDDALRGGFGDDVLDGGQGRDFCTGGKGKTSLHSCEKAKGK